MTTQEIVFSILITIAIGLSSFSLVWMFNTNAKIAVMDNKLSLLLDDSENDERQDSQLSKHWQLHSWSRGQVNELRVKNDMDLATWPDLH